MTHLNFTSFRKVTMHLHLTEDAALGRVPYQHHFCYNLSGWLLCMLIILSLSLSLSLYIYIYIYVYVCMCVCFTAMWHTCTLLFPQVNSMCSTSKLWFSTWQARCQLVHHAKCSTHTYSTWSASYKLTCTGKAFRALNVVQLKYMYVTRYAYDTHWPWLAGTSPELDTFNP